jgi:undecaprenyl-diphosphatase
MPTVTTCLGLSAIGVSGVIVSATIAVRGVSAREGSLFRRVNGAPDRWFLFVYVPMQFGTYITTPVLATIAWTTGRHTGAIAVFAAGTCSWVLAKIVKRIAARDRPQHALQHDVSLRGPHEGGSGFPSGHAATSMALAIVLGTMLGGWWWALVLVLAAVTAFGRMYVGVHLPLDLVGGAGIGSAVAGLTLLMAGTLG